VLNDPLRGVDANTKQDLYALFRELAADGLAIILLSTEVLELLTLCDRIAVFNRGAIRTVIRAEEASEALIIAAMFGEDRR
jgi:ribose transport system ATP-binding protein